MRHLHYEPDDYTEHFEPVPRGWTEHVTIVHRVAPRPSPIAGWFLGLAGVVALGLGWVVGGWGGVVTLVALWAGLALLEARQCASERRVERMLRGGGGHGSNLTRN